jgi:uncharacterized membrane protein YccC
VSPAAEPPSPPAEPLSPAGRAVAVGVAFRQAGRFDRAKVSLRSGLVAAIPVVAMLSLGTLLGSPSAAVTMGVGAMLVGVAWRAGDGPLIPPIGTMAAATTALGTATLAGTLTGSLPRLHLLVLVIFCLLAGSATSLGRGGSVVGNQSLIAFIVFGRFPQSLPQALLLTGLVIAGGATQTLFAALVAVPLAWRRQRAAVAAAYRALADFNASSPRSSIPAATALDAAESIVDAPALFADRDRSALAALVSQGRRIRLELMGFTALLNQMNRSEPDLAQAASDSVGESLSRMHGLLMITVATIADDSAARTELVSAASELSDWDTGREPLPSAALDQRVAALVGQVAAAARLAAALRSPDRGAVAIPNGTPSRGARRIRRRIALDIGRMRTATTLHTPAGRHALRLAVVVALTELLVQEVALPRGYWAVVAAATVLRPEFAATFTRGAERVLGTSAGVVVATLIAVALDPSGWGVVAVVGGLAFVTYAVFPASFTAGTAMLTGVIVFLLHAVSPDTAQTALDRGIDTVIGGAIGLAAYWLWPTWSALSAGPLLAALVEAQHRYLDGVMSGLTTGRRLSDPQLRTLARQARFAFADAQTAIDLVISEPHRDRAGLDSRASDPRAAAQTLGALRRVVYGVHVLRLDTAAVPDHRAIPQLVPLQTALGEALSALAAALHAQHVRLPPLRTRLRQLARAQPELLSQALWAALDELVDATDTAAATLGLHVP